MELPGRISRSFLEEAALDRLDHGQTQTWLPSIQASEADEAGMGIVIFVQATCQSHVPHGIQPLADWFRTDTSHGTVRRKPVSTPMNGTSRISKPRKKSAKTTCAAQTYEEPSSTESTSPSRPPRCLYDDDQTRALRSTESDWRYYVR